jgi:flavin-binding protein dodecin
MEVALGLFKPAARPSMARKDRIMSVHAEHAKGPAVIRVVELVGVSDKSWSDAAQQAVNRASETMRHITGLDVIHSSAAIRDGKIIEYHVNVKVAFVVEPAQIEA